MVEELHGDEHGRWADVERGGAARGHRRPAAAARVGAPLGHDFCLLSLSDVLKPWAVVERRLEAAAAADFVLALYNPISRHRPWQLARALEIIGAHRRAGHARRGGPSRGPAGREDRGGRPERGRPAERIDMSTVLLVGSSSTRRFEHGGREWVYTPRAEAVP